MNNNSSDNTIKQEPMAPGVLPRMNPSSGIDQGKAVNGSGSLLTAASALTTMGGPSPEQVANVPTMTEPPKDALLEAGTKQDGKEFDEDIPMTFPQRLMEVLSDETHADVITWLPHGKGFIIYKKKKFAIDVLPKYFKQSKFTSFTRKLNRWGFTRITRGPETGAYYHRFFQRGNLRLCLQMSCQSVKAPATAAGYPPVHGMQPDPMHPEMAYPSITSQSAAGATYAAQENLLRQLQLQQQQQQLEVSNLFKQQMVSGQMGLGQMHFGPPLGLNNIPGADASKMYFDMLNAKAAFASHDQSQMAPHPQQQQQQQQLQQPQAQAPQAQPQQQNVQGQAGNPPNFVNRNPRASAA
eukprot:CAMPEP_0118709366 /NCGR_PEP_ID=MMETSP0800-20121206/22593_1 /TAXON_ID=210618 ORGANISM="Striatella unipunctata, Strain CCMP2910" /NCGR_SAMPLE_ID=MMETSP0800 /ASSEMBLY_ACC=CAM_ASM_000638 /LENGTH=352 /DNA_ID=CAMNT_0006613043 /DNA_START=116 /DNA_END=1174 /DNA_ORIENTATION=+